MTESSEAEVHDENWAVASAELLLNAWVSRSWITEASSLPRPRNIEEIYAIHNAMHSNPLAQKLGGIAGYKQGGVCDVCSDTLQSCTLLFSVQHENPCDHLACDPAGSYLSS